MVSACPHAAFDLVERMFERGGKYGIVQKLELLSEHGQNWCIFEEQWKMITAQTARPKYVTTY